MALANIPARRLIKIAKNSHRAIEDRADVAECLVKVENIIAMTSQKQI